MRKPILLILIALLALLLLGARTFAPSIAIEWWSIGPGSSVLTKDSVTLHSMIGQGFAGEVSLADTRLCSGYLCFDIKPGAWIYLPTIQK